MYRSGFFDDEKSSGYLHTSPNGGELINAQEDQDSTKAPSINQQVNPEMLPSSKSAYPVFDLEKYEQEKAQRMLPSSKSAVPLFDLKEAELENPYMSSSKSLIFPVDFKPTWTANQIEDKKREAFRKQPELLPKKDSDSSSASEKENSTKDGISIESPKKIASEGTTSVMVNWRAIWIGVLGILFVGVGSIVYFKRRSK